MNRTLLLILVWAFLVGFGFLTATVIVQHGVNADGVVGIVIVVFMAVGIVGALSDRRR